MLLLRDHGTRPLADVLKYAIGYAEHGHPRRGARRRDGRDRTGAVRDGVDLLGRGVPARRTVARAPASCCATPRSPPPGGGCSPRPAAAGRAGRRRSTPRGGCGARDSSPRPWSRAAARPTMDTSGERHAGTLTGDDLAGWSRRRTRSPSTLRLERLDRLQGRALEPGPGAAPAARPAARRTAAAYRHRRTTCTLLIEGCKLAMADREAWYGDARRRSPLDELLSRRVQRRAAGAGRRARLVRAAPRQPRRTRPAAERPRAPAAAGARPRPRARRPAVAGATSPGRANRPSPPTARPGATPATSTSSTAGATWSRATPSGGWLQSNPVVPELGFPLGTRLQMTWLEPGLPNSLTPGRRPRTTLTPSLALRDGVPVLAFGTPGGDQQDQWQLHFFLARRAARRRCAAGSTSRAPSTPRTGTTTASPAPSTRARMRAGQRHRGVAHRPGGGGGAAPPRPRRDRRRRLVGGPALRRRPRPGDRRALGGGQPARHAGVRGGPLSPRTGGPAPHLHTDSTRGAPGRTGMSVARALMEA